jgi:hypothetical protein
MEAESGYTLNIDLKTSRTLPTGVTLTSVTGVLSTLSDLKTSRTLPVDVTLAFFIGVFPTPRSPVSLSNSSCR